MANNVDPDETAHDEPSRQDLHCLQKCLSLSTSMKELSCIDIGAFRINIGIAIESP